MMLAVLHVSLANATTNAVDDVVRIDHSSSGTVAANFGSGILMRLEDSTGAGTIFDAVRISTKWTDASAGDASLLFGTAAASAITNRVELDKTGNLKLLVAGNGIRIKEGSNAYMGTATLVAGAATVSTTVVSSNSRIFVTSQADGGTPGWLRISARVAATSFTITSSDGADTSTVAWLIIEPS